MSIDNRANYHILYVDDEEKALQYFKECFEDEYVIHTATNAADAFSILEKEGGKIGILMTDQRMPGESGVELMERARRLQPHIVRILVTAYTDYDSAVKAVNEGRAWRYLHKPLDPELLSGILEEGLLTYQTTLNRERLLNEKAEHLRGQLMSDRVSGVGILAEGLNHHLRNALTVVRAFVDLAPLKLMEELDARPPQDPMFWVDTQAQAAAQIDRIQSLLMHLAQASHARKLERKDELSLHDLLFEYQATYAGHLLEKELRLEVTISPDFPKLLVHEERFRLLIKLLFIEEITHLQPGDQVQITAEVEKDALGDDYAIIRLTDSGAWGSPKDVGTNLFDPFYTRSRKPDDFGINMMACFVTMHLHGGTVTAQRQEQTGLLLTLRLPLDPDKNCLEAEQFLRGTMAGDLMWKDAPEMAA